MEAATRCIDLSLLPPLLTAGPPRLPSSLPATTHTSLPGPVEPQVPESGAPVLPLGRALRIITAPFPRLFLPWISPPPLSRCSRAGGFGVVVSLGERDWTNNSPRGGGRRQGLSASTAFGVFSTSCKRDPFRLGVACVVLPTWAATAVPG